MAGMLDAMLLLSRLLATVEGGGEGKRGIATIRLGGDCADVAIDVAILLRLPGIVDGGGEGKSGIATVRRGGDCGVVAIDVAMLLRFRTVPTTVEGGGEGRRGIATVRRGGDCEPCVGGREFSIADTAADNSLANADVKPDECREGMCVTRLLVAGGGRGRVRFLNTPSQSLIGRSWLMRT
jgi:hypothetical protein